MHLCIDGTAARFHGTERNRDRAEKAVAVQGDTGVSEWIVGVGTDTRRQPFRES
jgi:hypothetical protein